MKPITTIKYLVVHHSASPRNTTTVDLIHKWHVEDHGWDDIGYHWVITGDGKTHACRNLSKQGAHAPKVNPISWAVCVVGDNTKPDQSWVTAQEHSLLTLIDAVEFLIPDIQILGHRDTGEATLCPGLDIKTWLEKHS